MHWFSRHIQQFVYDSDTNHIKIQMYEREFKFLTYNNVITDPIQVKNTHMIQKKWTETHACTYIMSINLFRQ
jgi:hypothetical protein